MDRFWNIRYLADHCPDDELPERPIINTIAGRPTP